LNITLAARQMSISGITAKALVRISGQFRPKNGFKARSLSQLCPPVTRIIAVVATRVQDYFARGKRWWVRLHGKGGKRHEMPAHHWRHDAFTSPEYWL
jgi:hypothetical protein